LCFSAIFYDAKNPYLYFSTKFVPSGRLCRCGTEENTAGVFGEISGIGPYSLTACWAELFTSEKHTAGCGLHRVIAFGFRGIQDCICSIINKSVLAGWQQLFTPIWG